ncbi:Hypothetical protein, partial CDS, partial [Neorhizobium galegae bv. orientalis]
GGGRLIFYVRVRPPPSALPGISPTGGEIGWALAHRIKFHVSFCVVWLFEVCRGTAVAPLVISPHVGEMPGRA